MTCFGRGTTLRPFLALGKLSKLLLSSMRTAPYTLVDIGANLNNHSFKPSEIPDVIERARCAGVEKIIVTGTSVPNSREALGLVSLYPESLYFTAGLHPHDSKHYDDNTLADLEILAKNDKCVAIGECGLDFNRNFSPREDQIRAFDAQVELATRLKKPLFVHEREAHETLLEILLKKRVAPLPPTVIHCFTGTVSEACSYLDAGFYIGLTGFLWKDKLPDGVQYALRQRRIPMERLLLETDAPFMFPNLKAKKLPKDVSTRISEHARSMLADYCSFDRNEPCSLAATCELVAAFMDEPPERLAAATTRNAFSVFSLDDVSH